MPALKHQILDYLVHAPNAGDTVQGIADWWLLEQCIRQTVADVQRALEELVAEGLVKRVHRAGRTHYRVREDKLTDIRDLLASKCQAQ
jgi:predicted transcriptional regulator